MVGLFRATKQRRPIAWLEEISGTVLHPFRILATKIHGTYVLELVIETISCWVGIVARIVRLIETLGDIQSHKLDLYH